MDIRVVLITGALTSIGGATARRHQHRHVEIRRRRWLEALSRRGALGA
jgi:hypothetical protein